MALFSTFNLIIQIQSFKNVWKNKSVFLFTLSDENQSKHKDQTIIEKKKILKYGNSILEVKLCMVIETNISKNSDFTA